MKQLSRSILAGAIATGADAACFAVLAHAGAAAGASALAGAACGGLVGYVTQRRWVFASRARVAPEALRYAAVSASSGVLHALLVSLLAPIVAHALLAWALSRTVVFVGWTFPLFRGFAFRAPD